MEHARLVDDGKVQLVEAKLRVCAGLARERKFAVAVFVQRDECQRRENIVGCDKSFRFDPSLAECIGQQLPERVRADLSEQRGFSAKLGNRSKKVCRGTARMRGHRRITVRVGRLCRKIDQQLTERNNIIHTHSSVIAMLHVFSYSAPGAR